jgi:hypothetical protein
VPLTARVFFSAHPHPANKLARNYCYKQNRARADDQAHSSAPFFGSVCATALAEFVVGREFLRRPPTPWLVVYVQSYVQ